MYSALQVACLLARCKPSYQILCGVISPLTICLFFKIPKAAELIGKLNNITEADSYYRAMMMGGRLKRRLSVSWTLICTSVWDRNSTHDHSQQGGQTQLTCITLLSLIPSHSLHTEESGCSSQNYGGVPYFSGSTPTTMSHDSWYCTLRWYQGCRQPSISPPPPIQAP